MKLAETKTKSCQSSICLVTLVKSLTISSSHCHGGPLRGRFRSFGFYSTNGQVFQLSVNLVTCPAGLCSLLFGDSTGFAGVSHRRQNGAFEETGTLRLVQLLPRAHLLCRNFVKELVILFHRTAAAPWGHVASIIKKSSTGDSSSIFHSHRCSQQIHS